MIDSTISFPVNVWNGLSDNALRKNRSDNQTPDYRDWDQIVGEVIATQSYLSTLSLHNVKAHGAKGDGTTDDTVAIASAIAAAAVSGGIVTFPAGTYITGTQTIATAVHIVGSGIESTIIKLKSGTNADLIQSANVASFINIYGSVGTGDPGGAINWSIRNLTLDGNKASNTSSYVVRVYGYGWSLDHVVVRNGASGGIQMDWNGGSASGHDSMECYLTSFKIHDNTGIGLQVGGPHDSVFIGGVLWNNNSNIHIGPNSSALLFTNVHCWTPNSNFWNVIIEGGYSCWNGCEAEGVHSNFANLLILHGDTSWVGGHIFGTHGNASAAATGIQLGQTVTTTYGTGNGSITVTGAVSVGGCNIDTKISNCEGTTGSIFFAAENGNRVRAVIFQQSGVATTGTIGGHTDFELSVVGLTADGTIANGGGKKVSASSTKAMDVTDGSGASYFQVDTFSTTKTVSFQNNPKLIVYTTGGSTVGMIFNNDGAGGIQIGATNVITLRNRGGALLGLNGTVTLGQSTAAQSVATSGTIQTTQGTSPNIVTLGVARVTTAGAVTGVIMLAGTASGQFICIVNESANSITFAASSSNVSTGSSCVIAANMAKSFFWDSTNSLWYPTS